MVKVCWETHQALTKYKCNVVHMPRMKYLVNYELNKLSSNYVHFHFSPYGFQSSPNDFIHI